MKAIGKLKTKVTKSCTICGCSRKIHFSVKVYSTEPHEIESAKEKLKPKVLAAYTCGICKSIVKSYNKGE